MYHTLYTVVLFGCLVAFECRAAPGEVSGHAAPTNSAEVAIGRMWVTSSSAKFTILDLHRSAVSYLNNLDPEFADAWKSIPELRDIPAVHINVESREKFVNLRYGGGIGRRYWSVWISRKGKISSHSTGKGDG